MEICSEAISRQNAHPHAVVLASYTGVDKITSLSSRLELDLISSLDLVFGAIPRSTYRLELDLISSLDLVFGPITCSTRLALCAWPRARSRG